MGHARRRNSATPSAFPARQTASRAALLILVAAVLTSSPALAASVKLPCLDSTSSSGSVAPELLSRCEEVSRELLEGMDGKGGLKAAAKGYISRIYAGRQIEYAKSSDRNGNGSLELAELQSRSLPTPVCSVVIGPLVRDLAGESGRGGITTEVASNHLGQSCGLPAGIEVDGGLGGVSVSPVKEGSKGKLEGAILRSIVVMAMEEAYETIRREISQTRSFQVQAGTEPLVEAITSQQRKMSTAASSLAAEAKSQEEIFNCEKTKNLLRQDKTYEVNSIQQKGLQLCSAWKLSQAAVFQLAAAEMFERADANFRKVFSESSGMISRAVTEIGDVCQDRASDAAKDRLLEWRKAASRAASRCYEEKLVPFIQKEFRLQFPHVGASASPWALLLLLLARARAKGREGAHDPIRRKRRSRLLRDLVAGFVLTVALSACAGGCYDCTEDGKSVTPTALRVIAKCFWNNEENKSKNLDTMAYRRGARYWTCGESSTEIYCSETDAESKCSSDLSPTSRKLFPEDIPDNLHEINLALCGRQECDKAATQGHGGNFDHNQSSLLDCRDNVIATYAEVGETISEDAAVACCTPVAQVGGDGGRWCTFSNETCTPSGTDGPDTSEESSEAYYNATSNLAAASQALEKAGLLTSTADESDAEEVEDNLANAQGEQSAATAVAESNSKRANPGDAVGSANAPGAFVPGGGSGSAGGAGGGSAGLGGLFGSSNSGASGDGSTTGAKGGFASTVSAAIARLTGGGSSVSSGGSRYSGSEGSLSAPGGAMDFSGSQSGEEVPVMGSQEPDDYFTRIDLKEDIFAKVRKKIDEKERQWEFDRLR